MDKDRTEMDTTEKTEKELPADGGRGEAENRFSQDRTREGHAKHKGRFGAGVLTGMAGMLVIIAAAFGIRSWVIGNSLASSGVSAKDVENKLDVINGLIDEYYL